MQRFQGLRRTPLGLRVFTCGVVYHSNSTSRRSRVLRKSLLLLACATLSRTQTGTLGPPGLHLCYDLPLQLNIPPFLRITKILAFVGLSGCEMCCNLPVQLKIPPFPRITEILAFVGLCNTFNVSPGNLQQYQGFYTLGVASSQLSTDFRSWV